MSLGMMVVRLAWIAHRSGLRMRNSVDFWTRSSGTWEKRVRRLKHSQDYPDRPLHLAVGHVAGPEAVGLLDDAGGRGGLAGGPHH